MISKVFKNVYILIKRFCIFQGVIAKYEAGKEKEKNERKKREGNYFMAIQD